MTESNTRKAACHLYRIPCDDFSSRRSGEVEGIYMRSIQKSQKSLFGALALISGVVAFILFLFVTGYDPDDRQLTLMEKIIGSLLIRPRFGYLAKWRRLKGR